MEPTFNMHPQRPRARLCTACDCSVVAGHLDGSNGELGLHWEVYLWPRKQRTPCGSLQNSTVYLVCLGLGWVILKEVNRKALHVAGHYKHRANNCVYHFSNT